MKNKLFRWTVSYFLFVLIFSVTLVLSVCVSNVMGAVYDDFNGENINQNLWNINDDGNTLSQSVSLLHSDGPPNNFYGNIGSTNTFRGDFEFVLDYRNFQSTATVFVENGPSISIQVADASPESNFIYIFRMLLNGNHTFGSNGMSGGLLYDGFWEPALTTSGQLKISRTDSTITTFFNEGAGWVTLGTFPGAFTGDVSIQIQAYTGDNGTFHVSSDWITYEGHMLSSNPVPDIEANGSEGPVTILQQDLLTVTASLDPIDSYGEDADWWVAAASPLGLYWFTLNSGWVKSLTPIRVYGGPLFNLIPRSILEISTLPVGDYTFYFGVDMIMNGTLDLNNLFYDSVKVNIE